MPLEEFRNSNQETSPIYNLDIDALVSHIKNLDINQESRTQLEQFLASTSGHIASIFNLHEAIRKTSMAVKDSTVTDSQKSTLAASINLLFTSLSKPPMVAADFIRDALIPAVEKAAQVDTQTLAQAGDAIEQPSMAVESTSSYAQLRRLMPTLWAAIYHLGKRLGDMSPSNRDPYAKPQKTHEDTSQLIKQYAADIVEQYVHIKGPKSSAD